MMCFECSFGGLKPIQKNFVIGIIIFERLVRNPRIQYWSKVRENESDVKKTLTNGPATISRLIKVSEIITKLPAHIKQALLKGWVSGWWELREYISEPCLKPAKDGMSTQKHRPRRGGHLSCRRTEDLQPLSNKLKRLPFHRGEFILAQLRVLWDIIELLEARLDAPSPFSHLQLYFDSALSTAYCAAYFQM
jgi:hypothetical protein